MAQIKRILTCVLLIGVLALQAMAAPKAKPNITAKPAPKPITRTVNVLPSAAVVLPSGCKVSVRWVCPPLSLKTVDKSSWYDVRFAVDSKGRPWLTADFVTLINPTEGQLFKLERMLDRIACLDNGAFLVTSMADLGVIVPPEKAKADDKGIPLASFQPISGLPLPDCDIYPGASGALYLIGWNAASKQYDVYVLKPEKLTGQGSAVREYVKVFSSDLMIDGVAGDGETTYVAIRNVVLKCSRASGPPVKIYDGQHVIKSLAYSPQAGLFCATYDGVDRISTKGAIPILAVNDVGIYVQKGSLYVFFEKSLGVLALDGVGDLKRFEGAIKNVPATQSKEVKVTDIRMFEAGETAPEYADRKYSREFEKITTRFIYCQVDMTNLLKAKHKQVVSMELVWPGQRYHSEAANATVNFEPTSTAAWATMRFGSGSPDTFYPGIYTLKTFLNDSQIDERHFIVKGEANLLEAAYFQDSPRVRKQLENGADPNVLDAEGKSPLILAVENGAVEDVRLLLEHKADTEVKNKDGLTPLLLAADWYSNSAAMVKLLLEHGADANAKNADGRTALHLAARQHRLEIMRLLLEHKADPNAVDKDGTTPLQELTCHMPGTQFQATPEHMELLIKSGANPNLAEKDGGTPLVEAIGGPDAALVQVLLDSGADVNGEYKYSDGSSHSMLYYAILSRSITSDRTQRESLRKIVKLLSDKGAQLRSDEVDYILSTNASLLSRKQIVAALQSNNQSVWKFTTDDPWLRRFALKRMMDFAYGDIGIARDASAYKDALACAVFAKDRAELWGMASEVPDIYFDCGILAVKTGDTSTAKMYFSKYLEFVSTGVNADKARAMIAGW